MVMTETPSSGIGLLLQESLEFFIYYNRSRDYVNEHVDFVSGHNGTSPWEISLVTAVGPLSMLLRNLALPWLFPMKYFRGNSHIDFWLKLLLDLLLTVFPSQLAIMTVPHRLLLLVVILLGLIGSLGFFCVCEHVYSDRVSPGWSSIVEYSIQPSSHRVSITNGAEGGRFHRQYLFITYFRAFSNIATAMCILAVDFSSFPRRFAKTEQFGYGLMDLGVGVIVLASGMVSPETRNIHKRVPLKELLGNLAASLPLVAMGVVRLVSVKYSGYQEHLSEYGVHWNFFFTLASIKICNSIISCFACVTNCSLLLCVAIAFGYQYCLDNLQWRDALLNSSGARESFLDANREGLCSLFGYLSLFYAGVYLGVWIFRTKNTIRGYSMLWVKLVFLNVVFIFLLHFSDSLVEASSRRMANLTYITWIITVSLQILLMFLSVELIALFSVAIKMPLYHTGRDNELYHPLHVLEPCLWESVNYNGLFYFLLANVLTGLVNVALPTLYAPPLAANLVVFLYLFLLSTVTFSLYVRKRRLKCN